MVALFGKEWKREDLERRTGDMFQVGGILPVTLSDGVERGVRAAHVRSGSGFDLYVLLDRGMDIGLASYQGIPLTYFSPTGVLAPQFYDNRGSEWLRGFHGGLVVTCGLLHFGPPETDSGADFGLHDRFSYLPAREIAISADWHGADYVMEIRGTMRQAAFFGENLALRRRITVNLGKAHLHLNDTVENRGFQATTHRILYHVNPGFPLLDDGSILLIPTTAADPTNLPSRAAAMEYAQFSGPIRDFQEQGFRHTLIADEQGYTTVALVNRSLGQQGGLGLYVRYPLQQLPYFNEWKMTGEGFYVMGIEPSNTPFVSRAELHSQGQMPYLQPGECRNYELEIGVLPDGSSIDKLASWVRSVA